MKAIILTAIAACLLISAQSAVATPGYWTSSDSYPGLGLQKYHIYLYGSYPSWVGEATKIVNEHLNVCIDFNQAVSLNYTNPKPYLCHQVLASQIPSTNDSVIDAGFYMVPSSLNASNARACISLDYHNMYFCGGAAERFNHEIISLFYGNMQYLIYDDVWVVHACSDYHHLKEGTPKYDECISALS
jgi:hypothetical protein